MVDDYSSKHTQRDLDKKKFGADLEGKVVQNVNDSTASPIGTDYIAITYPTATTEVFTYKNGGSGGTTLRTITVTYLTSAKADISSVAYT